MKKLVSLKLIIMIMLSLAIIGTSMKVFATEGVLETETPENTVTSETTEVSTDDYNNAGTIPVDTNYSTDNNTTNTISSGVNTSSAYNTVDEDDTDLPQTGIEDYNIGILLVVFVGASIYTYKKMKDYKNI